MTMLRLLLAIVATIVAAVLVLAPAAYAASATPLDAYLDDMKTLRASFVQTLADAHGKEIDRSTGTLIVSRPGKFSWEIHPQNMDQNMGKRSGKDSGGQLMVADGRNLWFLDRDLQQVTVKPADAALSATPAMLLSGTVDVRKNFTITPAPRRDGLDWVLVEPHGTDADFRRALMGFEGKEAGQPALKRMILEDKLGQTATVMFDHAERNGNVTPEEVSFTPPAGVDVIGTPRK
jgi:outer membrane lipoprotein carrier protein